MIDEKEFKCSEGNGTLGHVTMDEGDIILTQRPDRIPCESMVTVISSEHFHEVMPRLLSGMTSAQLEMLQSLVKAESLDRKLG